MNYFTILIFVAISALAITSIGFGGGFGTNAVVDPTSGADGTAVSTTNAIITKITWDEPVDDYESVDVAVKNIDVDNDHVFEICNLTKANTNLSTTSGNTATCTSTGTVTKNGGTGSVTINFNNNLAATDVDYGYITIEELS